KTLGGFMDNTHKAIPFGLDEIQVVAVMVGDINDHVDRLSHMLPLLSTKQGPMQPCTPRRLMAVSCLTTPYMASGAHFSWGTAGCGRAARGGDLRRAGLALGLGQRGPRAGLRAGRGCRWTAAVAHAGRPGSAAGKRVAGLLPDAYGGLKDASAAWAAGGLAV